MVLITFVLTKVPLLYPGSRAKRRRCVCILCSLEIFRTPVQRNDGGVRIYAGLNAEGSSPVCCPDKRTPHAVATSVTSLEERVAEYSPLISVFAHAKHLASVEYISETHYYVRL